MLRADVPDTSASIADVRAAVVDAFTDRAFAGNPAAVVLLAPDAPSPSAGWMQSLAAELALSETAFVTPLGDSRYRLRWFTPTVEVDLCGHATLAAAHWLLEQNLETGTMSFCTRSGRLLAQGVPGRVRITLPYLPVVEGVRAPAGLDRVIGSPHRLLGLTGQAEPLQRDALVLVEAADLRELRVDLRRLAGLPLGGVIVTARADGAATAEGVDVLSRCFAPAQGIDEDPVTASAHSTLAAYWCAELGTDRFRAAQLSPRGGLLDVHLDGGGDEPVVHVTGGAVTTTEVSVRGPG